LSIKLITIRQKSVLVRKGEGQELPLSKAAISGLVLTPLGFFDRRHAAVFVQMTGAGAVPEFADAVKSVGVFVFFMVIRLKIISVAAGAIGFVGAKNPGDRLGIALVAMEASYARAVISRIRG
jgi:hypothetical protein